MNVNISIENEPDHEKIYLRMWVWDENPENAQHLFVKHKSKQSQRRFRYSAYNSRDIFKGNFINASINKPLTHGEQ